MTLWAPHKCGKIRGMKVDRSAVEVLTHTPLTIPPSLVFSDGDMTGLNVGWDAESELNHLPRTKLDLIN